MKRHRAAAKSIATRFASAALIGASLGFASLVALVINRLDYGLTVQATELGILSDHKLSSRLDADAKLIGARLDRLRSEASRNLASIAQRVDVQRAIAMQNVVAISEILGQAARTDNFDGIIAVDAGMRVIGAGSGNVDLLAVNKALHENAIGTRIWPLLDHNERGKPTTYSIIDALDTAMAAAVGAQSPALLAVIAIHPVFDDFGDVSGALIAHHALIPEEPTFVEFSALTNTALIVRTHDGVASQAGLPLKFLPEFTQLDNTFLITHDRQLISRCVNYTQFIETCALLQTKELYDLRADITRSGYTQGHILVFWLVGLSAFFLIFFAICSYILAKAVTRPLVRITQSVMALARGDWRTHVDVDVDERLDEVGDIARAVVELKVSVQERNRLKTQIAEHNATLTEQKDLLHIQNLRFNAALTNMSQGLCMLDPDKRVVVVNARYEELLGLDKGTIEIGCTLQQAVARVSGPDLQKSFQHIIELQKNMRSVQDRGNILVTLGDGRTIAVSQIATQDEGIVTTLADITARKRDEERIEYLAHHDYLTGLGNRITLRHELTSFEANFRSGDTLAILCLDLNRFKIVNDSYGHSVGDELLKIVGARLKKNVRKVDTVARVGGDEFVIVQRNPHSRDDIAELAKRIVETIAEPVMIEGRKLSIGVSIGIASAPDDGIDCDRLLKMADLALYRVKSLGVSNFRFFDPEMDARETERRGLERDLTNALENNEFYLLYQPIVDSHTTEIVGFEALLRWRHPERGIVSPAEFIPVAEEMGLIVPIGAWVVETACAAAMHWPESISVAVNISSLQVSGGGLGLTIVQALATSGLSPRRLELEITESVMLENNALTLATLHGLHDLGIRISMDDYGTGYSSLSSLRSFPFDKIKIDQSFVRELTGKDQNSLIVRSICSLAAGLGMTTVGEGVETNQQLEILRSAGCTALQGYFFGRPMSFEDARKIVAPERAGEVLNAA